MDPGILRKLMLCAFVPGVAALVLFGVLWWRPSTLATRRALGWIGECGVFGAVVLLGLWLVLDGFRMPPRSSDQLLPFGACAAMFGALLAGGAGSAASRWFAWAGGALLVGLVVTRAGALQTWPIAQQLALLGAFAAVAVLMMWCFARLADRASARLAGFAMLGLCAGAAQVLVVALASLKLAQAGGVVAATVGGALAISMFKPSRGLSHAGGAFAALMITAVLTQGVFFGEPALGEALLYAASVPVAALLAALVQTGGAARLPVGARWTLTALAVAIPPAIAVGVALMHAQSADEYEAAMALIAP